MADDVTPIVEDGAEAQEWASALDDFAPGYNKEETVDDKDTTTDTTTTETTVETTTEVPTTDETTTIDPNETPEQKTEREAAAKTAADESDAKSKDAPAELDASSRIARQTAREASKEVESIAKDVREKMFADVPTELRDNDGDPIKSIEDVMKLMNPRTQEAFTEEEAAMWLLSAQKQFTDNLVNINQQVEQIAEVNVDLKDQADSVNYQYGELLKEMPELRDQLWAEYSKTLVKDPKSDIITGMPVSLERFYDIALQPYVKLAQSLEAQASAQVEAEKAQAEVKKTRTRADRSDIFGRGKVDDMDDDEKEWSAAAKDYYESR